MGLEELYTSFKNAALETIKTASIYIPLDVYEALKKAWETEENPVAKKQLEAILENIRLAAIEKKPICQDTGMMIFYVEVGKDFPLLGRIKDALTEAVREATVKVPLRPNAVDPMIGKNTGDNTGRYMPWVEYNIVEGDSARITFVAKGGGGEWPTEVKMLSPTLGLKGAKRFIIETVYEAGAKPCPPVIVSVGIAGALDIALTLSKRGLTRPIGVRHPEPKVAELEEELLELINMIGIGPHGFGGKTTALDVKVDYGARHPACYAVAVSFLCWAARRATFEIDSKGKWSIISKHYMG